VTLSASGVPQAFDRPKEDFNREIEWLEALIEMPSASGYPIG